MGPEQDESKPAGVRQYATTLHAPPPSAVGGSGRILEPPDPMAGEPFELEGLQAQDAAGNLIYLWSRLRPGLRGAPEATGKLPLAVVQTVAQLVLEELGERLGRQAELAEEDHLGPKWLEGIQRANRVVDTLATQIGEAQIPESMASLVE